MRIVTEPAARSATCASESPRWGCPVRSVVDPSPTAGLSPWPDTAGIAGTHRPGTVS